MRRTLALMLVVGLSVSVAEADGKPASPSSELTALTPENHWRLAKLADAQPQRIGILTYYPNEGGGYTFLEHGDIVFYALPLLPTTYQIDRSVLANANARRRVGERIYVYTIGKETVPFGGQTLYRIGTTPKLPSDRRREDVPIAKWNRDTPNGQFRLSILTEDNETRVKLKSIIPVLEHAPKPLPSKP